MANRSPAILDRVWTSMEAARGLAAMSWHRSVRVSAHVPVTPSTARTVDCHQCQGRFRWIPKDCEWIFFSYLFIETLRVIVVMHKLRFVLAQLLSRKHNLRYFPYDLYLLAFCDIKFALKPARCLGNGIRGNKKAPKHKRSKYKAQHVSPRGMRENCRRNVKWRN